ncbi:MAG: plasmid mobilization relaxosome protein MobC [Bacteroidales bacterium]|jgi:hypothetical protein|nr:plasmid mobilization relaxosome protein MobC [Bacteroidales bacterium]
MARPKKEIEELLSYQTTVRLTQSEYQIALKHAQEANISISQWLRLSSLSQKPIKPKVFPISRETYIQLVKLGSNINQIAVKLNTGTYTKIYSEILEVKKLLMEISQKLSG